VTKQVFKEFITPIRAGLPEAKLTPAQHRDYQTAQAYMLIHAPFFADLLLSRLKLVATTAVPIAATDGWAVYINPEKFFDFTVKQQAFAIAHEILHCVLGDCQMMHVWKKTGFVQCPGGSLPYDSQTMNVAADFVINAMLVEAKVGECHANWLLDPAYSEKGMESCAVVYEKVYKKQKEEEKKRGKQPCDQPGNPGKNPGNNPTGGSNSPSNQPGKPGPSQPGGHPTNPNQKGFDNHLAPGRGQGYDADEATAKRNDAEWKVAVQAAANSAKAQGKLPASLRRFVGEIIEPKVSWQDRIKSQMQRRLGMDGHDFTRLDEQLLNRPSPDEPICFPAETAFGCGHIVIGNDTSGSMTQKEIDIEYAEMAGIIADLNPRMVTVLWCDAKVGRHDTLEEPEDLASYRVLIAEEGVKGGGGTDFRPVFAEIEKMNEPVDMLVYFTDGLGTFPKEAPNYPVVWGIIGPHTKQVPFGDLVEVEL